MLTQTVPVTKTGALVLARLLTPPARLSPATLRKNLEPFFRGRDPEAWQALFDETLNALERDGLITQRPPALTDAGRARVLEFLGLESLPAETTWPQIKSKYLVAAALGLPPADEAGRRRVEQANGLRVAVLRARYDLPPVETMSQALDALVRKALDMEPTEQITLGALKTKVLTRFLKLMGNPDLKEFSAQLPVDAVQATGASTDELRAAVLRNWLADEKTDAAAPAGQDAGPAEWAGPPPGAFDPTAFAERVRAAARIVEAGRGDQVLIAHVWRRLRDEGAFPDMTEAEFKQRLTEANRRGLLGLGRAHGTEGPDAAGVRESATPHGDAVFHFIEV